MFISSMNVPTHESIIHFLFPFLRKILITLPGNEGFVVPLFPAVINMSQQAPDEP